MINEFMQKEITEEQLRQVIQELLKDVLFAEHIKQHLNDKSLNVSGQELMCKVCNKTLTQILEEKIL